MKDVRFISAISDGSTDSSYQEAEIVFIRHCHNGEINVNFSLVKNIPKADADSISKVIMSGLKKFDDDYAKKMLLVEHTELVLCLAQKVVPYKE
jgi:hypothetical protein